MYADRFHTDRYSQRSKIPIAEEQFSAVLEMYARLGDVSRADDFVSKYLSGE